MIMFSVCDKMNLAVSFHLVCLNHVGCLLVILFHIQLIGPSILKITAPLKASDFFMGIAGAGRKCETVKYVDFVQEKQAVPAASDVQSESSDVQKSKKNDVDFIVKNVTEKQLDVEYIQSISNATNKNSRC